jgi:hypothetical protein
MDRRAAYEHAPVSTVVSNRNVSPSGRKRFCAGTKDPSHIRSVELRRVEVAEVANPYWSMEAGLPERKDRIVRRSAFEQTGEASVDPPAVLVSHRHKAVESGFCEQALREAFSAGSKGLRHPCGAKIKNEVTELRQYARRRTARGADTVSLDVCGEVLALS